MVLKRGLILFVMWVFFIKTLHDVMNKFVARSLQTGSIWVLDWLSKWHWLLWVDSHTVIFQIYLHLRFRSDSLDNVHYKQWWGSFLFMSQGEVLSDKWGPGASVLKFLVFKITSNFNSLLELIFCMREKALFSQAQQSNFYIGENSLLVSLPLFQYRFKLHFSAWPWISCCWQRV